jgi:hypothetical protein
MSNISNFELSSPTKVIEKENKDNRLIDSLDNLNLLYQSNKTPSEKKNSKFRKAGCDDKYEKNDFKMETKCIGKKIEKVSEKLIEKKNPLQIHLQLHMAKNGLDKNNFSNSKEIIGRDSKEIKEIKESKEREKKIICSGIKNPIEKPIITMAKRDYSNSTNNSNLGSSNNLTNYSTTRYASNSVIKLSSAKKSKI